MAVDDTDTNKNQQCQPCGNHNNDPQRRCSGRPAALFRLSPDNGATPNASVLLTESLTLSGGRVRPGWRHRLVTNRKGPYH